MLLSDFPLYIFAILFVLCVLTLISAKKSGHFVKALFTGAVGGLGALCAVGVIGQFIALSVGVNFLTVVVALTLSVPGVIMLLLIGIILL